MNTPNKDDALARADCKKMIPRIEEVCREIARAAKLPYPEDKLDFAYGGLFGNDGDGPIYYINVNTVYAFNLGKARWARFIVYPNGEFGYFCFNAEFDVVEEWEAVVPIMFFHNIEVGSMDAALDEHDDIIVEVREMNCQPVNEPRGEDIFDLESWSDRMKFLLSLTSCVFNDETARQMPYVASPEWIRHTYRLAK